MTTVPDIGSKDLHSSRGLRVAICAAAFAVTAVPLLVVEYLPFVDYPNHLARFYIWQNLDTSEYLATYYRRQYDLHPYWAMRLFVNGLSGAIGLDAAARAFVVLATLMPAFGACCVAWVIAKRITLLPLAALSVTYNYLVAWGFHNYLFAGGLALIVFAMWIGMGADRRWLRSAITAVLALALAFMHLLAVALLALLIFAWETAELLASEQRKDRVRRAAVRYLHLTLSVLPAVMFYASLDAGALGDPTTTDGGFLLRFVGLMSPFVLYGTEQDVIFNAVPLILVVAAVCAGLFRIPKREFIVLLILLAVAVALPYKLHGVAINWRVPVFLTMLVFAVVRPDCADTKTRYGIAITVVTLVLLRFADVTLQLTRQSKDIAELQQASEIIEPGSRVLPVFAGTTRAYYMISDDDRRTHYGAYLIPQKQILFPLQFIQYDIGFRGRYADYIKPGAKPIGLADLESESSETAAAPRPRTAYANSWRKNYDYLLVFGSTDGKRPADTRMVGAGSYFQILRIAGNN